MVMWNRWRDTVGTKAIVLIARRKVRKHGEVTFSLWDALFPSGKILSVNEAEFVCNPTGIHAEA